MPIETPPCDNPSRTRHRASTPAQYRLTIDHGDGILDQVNACHGHAVVLIDRLMTDLLGTAEVVGLTIRPY